MPSMLSHPAVPVAIAGVAGARRMSPALMKTAVVVSILPDADVITFGLGIEYGDFFGHRGFFHSPFFALVVALLGLLAWRRLGASRTTVFLVLFISGLSHGLFDGLTDGGMGIAYLSPFSNARYFFPWQPIPVSPIGVGDFISSYGMKVLGSELLWVWFPCLVVCVAGILLRRWRRKDGTVEPDDRREQRTDS